ncbi:MAG: hypothetical protein KGK09_02525, partial [Burkholderiales bacterium]|nr:hypothetical protein [Burkholderiales bacterium]
CAGANRFYDFERTTLVTASSLVGRAVALPASETPHFEFRAPAGTRPLLTGLRLSPGALQGSD